MSGLALAGLGRHVGGAATVAPRLTARRQAAAAITERSQMIAFWRNHLESFRRSVSGKGRNRVTDLSRTRGTGRTQKDTRGHEGS